MYVLSYTRQYYKYLINMDKSGENQAGIEVIVTIKKGQTKMKAREDRSPDAEKFYTLAALGSENEIPFLKYRKACDNRLSIYSSNKEY